MYAQDAGPHRMNGFQNVQSFHFNHFIFNNLFNHIIFDKEQTKTAQTSIRHWWLHTAVHSASSPLNICRLYMSYIIVRKMHQCPFTSRNSFKNICNGHRFYPRALFFPFSSFSSPPLWTLIHFMHILYSFELIGLNAYSWDFSSSSKSAIVAMNLQSRIRWYLSNFLNQGCRNCWLMAVIWWFSGGSCWIFKYQRHVKKDYSLFITFFYKKLW